MELNKLIISTGFLLVLTTISFSQPTGKEKVFKNGINICPLGIVLNYYVGNYEHLFGKKTGIMIQGGCLVGPAHFPGMTLEMQYRYHYFKKNNQTGLNSPFLGSFVCYTNRRIAVSSNPGDSTFIDARWFKVGANWGRRWIWRNSLNAAVRIGYGIPIFLDYAWLPRKPVNNSVEAFERRSKIGAGLDGELSAGFAF